MMNKIINRIKNKETIKQIQLTKIQDNKKRIILNKKKNKRTKMKVKNKICLMYQLIYLLTFKLMKVCINNYTT